MPLISVLMSVYNSQAFLREAVDSILAQTLPDFEFIIVDDGSTDDSAAILDSYTDARMVRLKNERNIGLTESLNRGLAVVRGTYLTRMDADDISVPDRFERQFVFLNAHPQVGMVGSNMTSIDAAGQPLYGGRPEFETGASDGYMRWMLHWANPIPHVTIFMRADILKNHHLQYDPAYNTVEEFELWTRLIQHTKFARMADVLIQRRIVETSVTRSRRPEQIALHVKLVQRELKKLLGRDLPTHVVETMVRFVGNESPDARYFSQAAEVLVESYEKYISLAKTLEKGKVGSGVSPAEKQIIQYQIVTYLMQMSTLGKTTAPLWKMRRVSPQHFFSRDTFYLARKAFYE